jgi:transposase-like protein
MKCRSRSVRPRRRPEEIQRILAEFRASGLSQNRFALAHGIHPVTLGYWIRRAEKSRAPTSGPRALVPVRLKAEGLLAPSPAFEVLLRSRRVLRVFAEFDSEALHRLVTVLDQGC